MKSRPLIIAIALMLTGCPVVYVDPPVSFDRPDVIVFSGDPAIELGIFAEQFYSTLAPLDELAVVAGFQGGTWVMPAIRIPSSGIASLIAPSKESWGSTRFAVCDRSDFIDSSSLRLLGRGGPAADKTAYSSSRVRRASP